MRDLLFGDFTLWEVCNRVEYLIREPRSQISAELAGMRTPWAYQEEILMQILEEVSVTSSGRQRNKPRDVVKRPIIKHSDSNSRSKNGKPASREIKLEAQSAVLRELFSGKMKPRWQQQRKA